MECPVRPAGRPLGCGHVFAAAARQGPDVHCLPDRPLASATSLTPDAFTLHRALGNTTYLYSSRSPIHFPPTAVLRSTTHITDTMSPPPLSPFYLPLLLGVLLLSIPPSPPPTLATWKCPRMPLPPSSSRPSATTSRPRRELHALTSEAWAGPGGGAGRGRHGGSERCRRTLHVSGVAPICCVLRGSRLKSPRALSRPRSPYCTPLPFLAILPSCPPPPPLPTWSCVMRPSSYSLLSRQHDSHMAWGRRGPGNKVLVTRGGGGSSSSSSIVNAVR